MTAATQRSIAMLDLKAEYRLYAQEVRETVEEVLEGGQFIGGPSVERFEKEMSRRIGVDHAMAVSSGTDAILCTLMALGIGPGDEVVVPSFTFFATAGCVARVGATPIFAEIDPRGFLLDPERLESLLTPRTRAIIPVHLYGQCADMDAIREIARRRQLFVIEDAAQAVGATYGDRNAGTLGDVACLSFYPTKNLGGFGEGGMILTNDARLSEIVRQLRTHGESRRYIHERIGGNFRLDTLKAALLLVKLNYLDHLTRKRQWVAGRYDDLLGHLPIETPRVAPDREHVYHQYTILCDRRDELKRFLQERGVATGVYYPIPLHLQKCFTHLGYSRGSLPTTEAICEKVLSLPCHPMLEEEELHHVASSIGEFYGRPSLIG